jgi:hypothetical protein
MSIRRLGDVQLFGPTSQATSSFGAGVMLDAADYATWQQEANAANQASYAATVAAYTAMTTPAQPAAPAATAPAGTPATAQATTPVASTWEPAPGAIASASPATASIPEWVYWAAAAAALLVVAKAL